MAGDNRCTVFDFTWHGQRQSIYFPGDFTDKYDLKVGAIVRVEPSGDTFNIDVVPDESPSPGRCRIMAMREVLIRYQDDRGETIRDAVILHLADLAFSTVQ